MSWRLLRSEPAFRRLWFADAVVDLGEGLQGIALPWLVLVTTGDPLQLGLALALRTTPDILAAPAVGYLVDAWPRRRVMLVTLLGEAAALAVVPTAAAAGWLSVGVVYAVLTSLSVLYAGYNTAREAALPSVVGEDRLDEANALFHGATDALSLGFLLAGGVLTDTLGAVTTTGLAAVAVGLATLPVVGLPGLVPEGTGTPAVGGRIAGVTDSLRAGVRTVRGSVVRDVLLVGVLINIAVVPYSVLSGSIARTVLGGSIGWAALRTAFRAGSLVSNGFVPRIPLSRRDTLVVGLSAVAVTELALAGLGPSVSGLPPPGPLLGLGGLLLLFGAAQPIHNVPGDSLVQAAVDDSERGQVVALTNAGLQLGFPVGYLGAGALAARTSAFDVFGVAGGLALAVALGAGLRFRRACR